MTTQTVTYALAAESRTATGKKNRALRRQGFVPAVVYGHQQESCSLTLNAHEFALLFRDAGTSTLIDLTIDGQKSHKVLVHEVQRHPATSSIRHIDFYQVNMKEKLETEISLEFTGVAPAVDVEGGSLIIIKDAIEVECLPQDLVSEISVDISGLLTLEDVIRVKDVVLPPGLIALADEEEIVASIAPPRSEEELEALDEQVEDTTAEVEVEKGGEEEVAPEEETEKKSKE